MNETEAIGLDLAVGSIIGFIILLGIEGLNKIVEGD
jgi:hypothetical protein